MVPQEAQLHLTAPQRAAGHHLETTALDNMDAKRVDLKQLEQPAPRRVSFRGDLRRVVCCRLLSFT